MRAISASRASSDTGRPRNRRSRILALLQDHPHGLTEEQITAELGVRQTIGPLLAALVRDTEVTQRGRGRYVLASPQAPG
jgi:predicted transcriptional regulator